RLYNDATIMSYWFEEAYCSRAVLEEFYEKNKDNQSVRSFILQNKTEKIGLIKLLQIDFIHRNAEFAIMIDPTKQGNGYAATATKLAIDYAFRTLNLHKFYLTVDEMNEKAIHIYEKAGFTYEATLKDEYFINGSYHNIVYMSMFQDDYLK